MEKISIAYSYCPNDTFIFDAMVHHKIDTEGLTFEVIMGDVEDLNNLAFKNTADVTKLSFHAFGHLTHNYILLNSGSALGRGCGPLLITRPEMMDKIDQINNWLIGIPGKNTTANFLLGLAFPNAKNKKSLVFSDIENELLEGKIDAGLIIHENRFTYQQKGLVKIKDLGEFWEEQYALPIPLGGIAANRRLPLETIRKIDRVLRKSIEFAFQNPNESKLYVQQHAQELSEEVCKKHIDLYVNDFSVDLGSEGIFAVETLMKKGQELGILEKLHLPLVVD